jgi:DNA-directed RNA polymerase specialized sigma24 family protein
VERDEAVGQLPVTYQRLLAWREEGRSGDEIAARLGVELSSIEPLLRLAEAKLARLTADAGSRAPVGHASSAEGRP